MSKHLARSFDMANLLEKLTEIGKKGVLDEIKGVMGAGIHSEICQIAGSEREEITTFCKSLSSSERIAFVKAIAAYENTVGGIGSVTSLTVLLPLVEDPDKSTLNWILANTDRYGLYSYGAKSASEYEAILKLNALRRDQSIKKEKERELEAKNKRANEATNKLYNAVKRGDIKAVRALLGQGADPNVKTPDGITLYDYSVSIGQVGIASMLSGETEPE
jgi:hypothetical protein